MLNPNSSIEQIIPFDSIPRNLTFLILKSLPKVALGKATITFWPAATLGAPQIICKVSLPTSTWQTLR